MGILIVEETEELGRVWKDSLERQGFNVFLTRTQGQAIEAMRETSISVVILDVDMTTGSAFAVADFASYRHPGAKVVFVTSSSFFSDGSIFQYAANANAFLPLSTPPEDLVAVVEHFKR